MLLPPVGRQQPRVRIVWWGIVAFLCLGVFLHLLPIYVVLITSLKSSAEVLHFPPTWFPQQPTTVAWQLVTSLSFGNNPAALALLPKPMSVFFLNSLFIATFTLLI